MHKSYNGSRSTTYWSEHNRVRILIVYHSIANVTDKHQHIPTQNHTRAHTLPRPRHSCPEHITTDGPAFAIHTDKVRHDNWIALCSPFQKKTSKRIRDTSWSHTNTHIHTRAQIATPTSQLPWSHPTWRTRINISHWQSSTWHLDSPLLSISKADIKERRWYILAHKHKQKMTE